MVRIPGFNLRLLGQSTLYGFVLSSLQVFLYRHSVDPLVGLFNTRPSYYQWIESLSHIDIFSFPLLSSISQESIGAWEVLPSFLVSIASVPFSSADQVLFSLAFLYFSTISALLLVSSLPRHEKLFASIFVVLGLGHIVLVNETIRLLVGLSFFNLACLFASSNKLRYSFLACSLASHYTIFLILPLYVISSSFSGLRTKIHIVFASYIGLISVFQLNDIYATYNDIQGGKSTFNRVFELSFSIIHGLPGDILFMLLATLLATLFFCVFLAPFRLLMSQYIVPSAYFLAICAVIAVGGISRVQHLFFMSALPLFFRFGDGIRSKTRSSLVKSVLFVYFTWSILRTWQVLGTG